MFATVFLSLLVLTTQAHGRAPTRQKLNYMSRLRSSCDDGLGQSCYDYALYLRDIAREKDPKKIQRYIHRACALTYQPACGKSDKPQRARALSSVTEAPAPVKNGCAPSTLAGATFSPIGSPRGLQITRIERDSMFERAGMRLGDVVTKINGNDLASRAQINEALGEGRAMIEIQRAGAVSALAVSCR